jgi:hypothetical protein
MQAECDFLVKATENNWELSSGKISKTFSTIYQLLAFLENVD